MKLFCELKTGDSVWILNNDLEIHQAILSANPRLVDSKGHYVLHYNNLEGTKSGGVSLPGNIGFTKFGGTWYSTDQEKLEGWYRETVSKEIDRIDAAIKELTAKKRKLIKYAINHI